LPVGEFDLSKITAVKTITQYTKKKPLDNSIQNDTEREVPDDFFFFFFL
jgi:hypothetical protein